MTNDPSTPRLETIETVDTPCDRNWLPSLCWKAIFGGTVAAIAIHILLTLLGVGAGLATFTPLTDAAPVEHFSKGAAIIWSGCALVALWFGGLVAGRFSQTWHSGFVHGILVWSLTLIITLLLISMGTGMVLGGGLKVLGAGIGMGGKAVASGVGDLAKEAATRGSDQLTSFIDEATQSVPTNSTPKASIRAKREVGFAVMKLFSPDNDVTSGDNRASAIKSLVDYTQMSEADATTTVDGWIKSYQNLKKELDDAKAKADQKAKEIADKAAHNLSKAAIFSFFALLIGLIVAALGGSCGGRCARRHADARVVTTKV